MPYADELIFQELRSIQIKIKELVVRSLPNKSFDLKDYQEVKLDLIIIEKKISALMDIVDIQIKDAEKAT